MWGEEKKFQQKFSLLRVGPFSLFYYFLGIGFGRVVLGRCILYTQLTKFPTIEIYLLDVTTLANFIFHI